jgi:hypothetical protein
VAPPRSLGRLAGPTAAFLAAAALLLTHPPPAGAAGAPAGAPAGGHPAEPGLSVPNPFDWLFENMIGNPFRSDSEKTLKTALDASEASFLTPSLDSEPRVAQLWQLLLEIADSVLLLLVVIGAVMVVAGDWTYLEAKALAPRVVVAGVVMNLSLVIIGLGISWSNDLVKGFSSFGDSSLSPAVDHVVSSVRTPIVLALLLIAVLFLLLANLIRLVVMLVLAVGAPLMNVFGVLPATDGIARAWWRAMAACLIAPAVESLLLVLGVWIAASGGSPFASVFGNPVWSGLVDSSLLIVIVALMAISPLWMLKHALGDSHRHLIAAFKWSGRAMGVVS